MTPLLRFAPYGIAVLLIVGGVAYVHQRAYNRGQASVQVKWDADKALQARAVEKQLTENARLQNEADLLRYLVEQELKPKLAASRDLAADLTKRLRDHISRSSAVSETPITASDPDGTSGVGSRACTFADGVGTALEDYFGAASRDSLRLNAWISWYEQLPAELKGE
jgi:hypothetical protein